MLSNYCIIRAYYRLISAYYTIRIAHSCYYCSMLAYLLLNCYRFASPADPFQMFRDSMEVRWTLDRVSQSVDASWTSGD